MDCLVFTDDLALLAEDKEKSRKILEKLCYMAEKTGLKISYEKTEYMEYKHDRETYLDTKFGNVKRTDKFQYLRKWNQLNWLDKEANKGRVRKI